jgi:hypothetical protein
VLRAIIDSSYGTVLPGDTPGMPEVLLYDHFDLEDDRYLAFAEEWLSDSLPDVPRDLIRDFSRVATDHSSIEPFELGRGKLHLIGDSTLARFFGRRKPGWEGFRRAFPLGGGIVTISRAGLSRDGRWAILYAGVQSDWLSGAGELCVLYNEGEVWHLRHRYRLWIS